MSKFKCEVFSIGQKEDWNQFVKKHDLGTFFHLYEWISFAEKKSGYKLYPLTLHKGGKLYAVFPVFLKSKYGISVLASPPPKVSTPAMGPLLMNESSNQYKKEKNDRDMIIAFHEYLVEELGANYIKINCVVGYEDVRQFTWRSYCASPRYTYHLNISKHDSAFDQFDGRVRTGIRKASEEGAEYIHEATGYGSKILELVQARYNEQGLTFPVTANDLVYLQSTPLAEYIHVNAVTHNDDLLMGNILLKYQKKIHHWIGGVKPEGNINGVNELLHWNGMEQFSKQGFTSYELMGGNTEHLCDHKSKYNPELKTSYEVVYSKGLGSVVNQLRKII